MAINRSLVKLTVFAGVFIPAISPFFAIGAIATPTRLECTLKSSAVDAKAANRAVTILFDVDTKKLTLSEAAQDRDFANVTMSTVSINGSTQDMSIGIDKSSWSIVLQTYFQDHVDSEFGVCRQPGPRP